MESIKSKFGKAFRERRDELKLSRDDLARMLGISKKTIQSWEIGRTFPQDLSLFPAIERHLQVGITELIRKAMAA